MMNHEIKALLLVVGVLFVTFLQGEVFQFTNHRDFTISGGYVNSWLSGEYVDDWNLTLGLDDLKSRHDFFIDLSYLITTENNLIRFEPGIRYINRGWTWWDKGEMFDEYGHYLGINRNTYGREKLYYNGIISPKGYINSFLVSIGVKI